MTRFVRVAATAVLFALSVCVQANAAFVPHPQFIPAARLDVSRVFGAGQDSWLSVLGSLHREMSFVSQSLFNVAFVPQLDAPQTPPPAIDEPAGVGVARIRLSVPHFEPARYVPTAPQFAAGSGLQVPHLTASAAPGAIRTAEPALASASAAAVHFGNYEPYAPSFKSVGGGTTVPVRVGSIRFEGAFHAMQLCGTADPDSACSSMHDGTTQNFTAGTDFDVRAGKSNLKVQISSSLEHLTNEAAGVFPYEPVDPDAQAGLSYYGLTDVVKHGVNAQVAVPVSPRITVGLQYDTAHYQGDYNTTLLPGFDARKDTYLGNVTYQLPNENSAITLSARQYRYQDTFAPNFSLTQTRADLDYTVKF